MTVTCITDNTTVQNGSPDEEFTGTETVYIGESAPDYTYDSDGLTTMSISETSGAIFNALVRFTGLSNISSGVTVNSATLYLRTGGGFGSIDAEVYGLLRAWVVANATYNDYTTSTAWATAGGKGTGDIQTPATDTTTLSSGSTYYSWDVTDNIQDILDGTITNDGNILSGTTTASNFWQLGREDNTDGQRPELFVDWTAASGGSRMALTGVGI